MLFAILAYRFCAIVRVAIKASVFACVVGTDVDTRNAAALRSLILVLFNLELAIP